MVVLMTGHDRAEFSEQIESGTFDLVLCKPFDLLEIIYILQPQQAQLEQKRPARPQLRLNLHDNRNRNTV